ncbi:MAG: phage portal protein [Candidatus Anstonellaceae archaeon]
MGAFDILRRLIPALNRQSRQAVRTAIPLTVGQVINQVDGPTNNSFFESNSNLFAVIDFIAGKAAKVPFVLYRLDATGRRHQVRANHPLLSLLEKPNSLMGRSEFLKLLYSFRLVHGNAYVFGPRLSDGRALELWVLPSHLVNLVSGGHFEPVKKYTVQTVVGTQYELDAQDVCHIRNVNLNWDNGENLLGLSPLEPLKETLRKMRANYEAQEAQMKNGGALGALYEDPSDSYAQLTPEQRDLAQRLVDERINGSSNVGRVIYLSTKHGYINFGLSSREMQLIEDAKFSLQDICRVYHLPSILLLDDAATYNNLQTARKAAYTDAILPLVEEFVDKFNAWIVPSFGDGLILDYDTSQIEELQTDKVSQASWLAQAWWVDVYRKQEIIGEIPDERMKGVYMLPSGLTSFDPDAQTDFERIFNQLTDNGNG